MYYTVVYQCLINHMGPKELDYKILCNTWLDHSIHMTEVNILQFLK